MQNWSEQDAKTRFNKLVDTCLSDGPQLVTRRDTEAAVLVSMEEWQRMQSTKPSLKSLLLSSEGRTNGLLIPKRESKVRRAALTFK